MIFKDRNHYISELCDELALILNRLNELHVADFTEISLQIFVANKLTLLTCRLWKYESYCVGLINARKGFYQFLSRNFPQNLSLFFNSSNNYMYTSTLYFKLLMKIQIKTYIKTI